MASTIFYAFSGGQESDAGFIGDYAVIAAQKEDLDIVYTLEDSHQLKAGDRVLMKIDWPRRFQLMRLHFAAEIVLELVCKNFPDVIKIGAHIAQDKSRIDFQWSQSITPFIPMLTQQAQAIIDSSQEIISAFSDERNQRRYRKVAEFAAVPCGGTHLKNTKEVGTIFLKRTNPGKGKERIKIYVS